MKRNMSSALGSRLSSPNKSEGDGNYNFDDEAMRIFFKDTKNLY